MIDLLTLLLNQDLNLTKILKQIAGGRVWIATSAKEIGLIDEIGGIDDAITYAANMAELEDYQG